MTYTSHISQFGVTEVYPGNLLQWHGQTSSPKASENTQNIREQKQQAKTNLTNEDKHTGMLKISSKHRLSKKPCKNCAKTAIT